MSRRAVLLVALAYLAVAVIVPLVLMEEGPSSESDAAGSTLTLSQPSTKYVKAGTRGSFTPSCTASPEGASITYSVSNVSDSGLTVSISNGKVYYRWTAGAIGDTGIVNVTFSLTASATGYTSSTKTVTVVVKNVLSFTNTSASGTMSA